MVFSYQYNLPTEWDVCLDGFSDSLGQAFLVMLILISLIKRILLWNNVTQQIFRGQPDDLKRIDHEYVI